MLCSLKRLNEVYWTKKKTTVILKDFACFSSTCFLLYVVYSKTWTDARDSCRMISKNSNLVSIHSLAENTFVASLFNGSLFAAWIGLSDRGVLFGMLF